LPLRARSCTALLLVVVASIQLALVAEARGAPPRIEDVEESLARDRSYRVRVSAALVLGRLGKPRSLPALINALAKDPHPAVRATAAHALGLIGDRSARGALDRATNDGAALVRRTATVALKALDERAEGDPLRGGPRGRRGGGGGEERLAFDVKPMGDRSHHASPALRGHMRDFLSDQLRPIGDIASSTSASRGFVVDGVIKNLSMTTHPDTVEISCAVQLVVSRQPTGGVFLLTTGEAIVQKPKRQFKPDHRTHMELEALESAVRGASEDLIRRLSRP
jgi:hypothetical protein